MGRLTNFVSLQGRVCKDADIREVNNSKVFSFTLATEQRWQDKKTKEWMSKPSFHNVEKWDYTGKYPITKGIRCDITGSIDYQTYEKEGVKQYMTKIKAQEIRILDKPATGENQKTAKKVGQEEIPF